MKLEVRNIRISSLVLSAFPLAVFCIAVLGGIITFFFMNNPQLAPMTAMQKLMSVGLFSLVYVVMTTALAVFFAFLYNLFGAILGLRGIEIDIDESEIPDEE